MTREADTAPIGELRYKPAVSHEDQVLRGMAEALLPFFREPSRANRLFMDHLMLAVGHHAAPEYGGMRPVSPSTRGGLIQNQERRAKELLAANLSGDIPLAVLARECGFSDQSHFTRFFSAAVGTSPGLWRRAVRE